MTREKQANGIEVEHVYAHPPSAVWKVLTDPELHARWWAAGDVRPIASRPRAAAPDSRSSTKASTSTRRWEGKRSRA